MKALLFLALAVSAAAFGDDTMPAPIPLNPDVTEDTLDSTICVSGYTKTVRPPVSYTNKLKLALMKLDGIPRSRASEFELDHHVPLTLGGAPKDPRNLQLQAWAVTMRGWTGETAAKVKDKIEVKLNHLVCSGAMPLAEAQVCIWNDWRACAAGLK